MSKAKKYIETVRGSWTYRNPLVIIILALVTVILWREYSHMIVLPTYDNSITVERVESKTVACDYKCLTIIWVEMRTLEIVAEKQETIYQTSRIEALLEANALITQI